MISFQLVYNIFFFSSFVAMAKDRTFIKFEKWSEKPINFSTIPISLPPEYVIITDTKLGYCNSSSTCKVLLNEILNNEQDKRIKTPKFPHFFIGNDGYAYEVRGWDSFALDNPIECVNSNYIEITLVINFKYAQLQYDQISVIKNLLESGVREGKLSKSYKIFGEWQLSSEIGGWSDKNQNILKRWPNWSVINNNCYYTSSNNLV